MALTLYRLCAAFVLIGCLAAPVAATAKDSEGNRSMDFRDFTIIDVSGVYKLDVVVGEEFSFKLAGEEALLDRADVQVVGRTLKLRTKKGSRGGESRVRQEAVRAIIRMPELEGLRVSGVASGSVKGIDSAVCDLSISGVGHIDLSGVCGSLTAELSGVGDLKAGGLRCRSVDVNVSGVGSAWVFASEEIDATVSGVGKLRVSGDPPKVNKRFSGFLSSIVMD